MNKNELSLYSELLSEIKARVRQAQQRAVLSANAEMILMYWNVGRLIASRQEREGWGAKVLPAAPHAIGEMMRVVLDTNVLEADPLTPRRRSPF